MTCSLVLLESGDQQDEAGVALLFCDLVVSVCLLGEWRIPEDCGIRSFATVDGPLAQHHSLLQIPNALRIVNFFFMPLNTLNVGKLKFIISSLKGLNAKQLGVELDRLCVGMQRGNQP